MRLEHSLKSHEFARRIPVLAGLVLFCFATITYAQNPPAVMSTGNSGSAARVAALPGTPSGTPSGQLLLDRRAPIIKFDPTLKSNERNIVELSETDDARNARPVSSNVFQQSLPAAVVPNAETNYSTASPYQLREINQSNTPLRAIPVSSTKSAQIVQANEELRLRAPKVSRIPVPQSAPTTESGGLASTETLRTSDKPLGPPSLLPQRLEVPSLESEAMPELPPLLSDESRPTPELEALPSFNASELGTGNSAPQTSSENLKSEAGTSAGSIHFGDNNSQVSVPLNTMTPLQTPAPAAQPVPSIPKTTNHQFTSPTSEPISQNSALNKKASSAPSSLSRNAPAGIERLRMQTPRIQVSLNGPKELAVGSPQSYNVVVRNDDKINLGGLILRLDIPPGVATQSLPASHGKGEIEQAQDGTTMLTWSFENLEGGAEATLPLQVIAESPRNFAVAMEWTLLPISGSAGIEVLTPMLELALEGPNEVNFSEPNVFRLHIRNRGNAEASDVTVKLAAEHFGSSTTQIGRIAAGDQQTVDVELVFNEPGNIVIAAEASTAGNVAAASQVGVLVRQSVLEAMLEAPERAYHSAQVPYILTLKNSGDAIARNAKAVVTLPPDCTPSSLPPQAKIQNGNIVFDLNQIRPGQNAELPFSLAFAREGENQVSVHCVASTGAPVQCTAVTSVKAVTDLKLVVTDPVAPAPVNGEVEYELKVVNRGSKAAEQVSVVALFSKDIEPTRAEGHRSQIVTGQVRFQPINRIEPGQTVTLRVFAQASAAGTHRFRAEIRTSEPEVKLVQEQSTEYMESIRRTATSPGTVIR
jgi:Domain of unknown function DUF11/CARDB